MYVVQTDVDMKIDIPQTNDKEPVSPLEKWEDGL